MSQSNNIQQYPDFLKELNEVQFKAVTHVNGPSMIVAGAGSGKTRVLTYKIAYLMLNGVPPYNILSLTFTNKAAKEMKNRIEKLVGTEARSLWMGTFHSVFSKLLRFEAEKIGFTNNFTIYDTDDSKNLIKTIIKENNLSADYYKPNAVYSKISLAKNNFISPAAYQSDTSLMDDDLRAGRPKLYAIYDMYIKRCHQAGAMDFDDLLLNTFKLFNEHPDVLNKYQHKFRYCLVDEYQDTNQLQYMIIRKLTAVNQNVCVVGDDAQSIYAFRGANISNILNFEKDYDGVQIFKLEQNYRSTKNIVAAASDIISKNKYQLKKEIWTANSGGDKIKVVRSLSDNEEGAWVASSIFSEKMSHQLLNKDFAILYRTNSQSRAFEEGLRRRGISYRIVGGTSFYQRKEVKDLLAYFRLAVNPKDEEALKRIINYPARGIGDTTMSKIQIIASSNSMGLWEVISNINSMPFEGRVKKPLLDFVTMMQSFQYALNTANAYDIAMEIAKRSSILKVLFEDKTIEGVGRYENVGEVLTAIKVFTENPEQEDKTLSAFLNDVSLMTDADNQDDSDDKVTMMTIHGSKGLEFPYVYVVGLEENLFPSQMAMGSQSELEEERRLFYVALTRAEKRAFLTYAVSRFRFGSMVYPEPSRFIDEINPEYLDYEVKENPVPNFPFIQKSGESSFKGDTYSSPKPLQTRTLVNNAGASITDPDFVGDNLLLVNEGSVVLHAKFGKGTVKNIEGEGLERKLNVDFASFGTKLILVRFAKMKILS